MRLGLALGIARGGLAATGPMPPGSPALFVRADLAPLGALSSWQDLSGSGHSPAQATGSKQPVNTAGVGPKASQPAVVFTAANSQLLSIAGTAILGTKNFTLAVVGKVNATNVSRAFVAWGTSGNGFLVGVDNNATQRRDFNANAVSAVSDSTNVATTNWEAWIFSSDASGNLTLTVNGATHTLSPTSATALTPTAQMFLGALNGGSGFLDGALWEVIAYPTALDSTGLAALSNYQHLITGLF